MTWNIEPAEPVTMEVALGSGVPGALTVHWEDGTLYARAGSESPTAFQPSGESWKHFWRAVDKADVWAWESVPLSGATMAWRIALDSGMKRVVASGMSFPSTDDFKTFIRALKTLLPGIHIPIVM